jgi:hypothetical protein
MELGPSANDNQVLNRGFDMPVTTQVDVAPQMARATRIARDRVILMTNLPRKTEEWCGAMATYGLKVEQVPYPDSDDAVRALASRPDVRFVCDESSNLFKLDGLSPCDWTHLEEVIHISRITVYRMRGDEMITKQYSGTKLGFLDLISGGKTADGWWDTAFRLASTGESYHEQIRKCSARDDALSNLMSNELHYGKTVPAASRSTAAPARSVNFDPGFSSSLRENPLYTTSQAESLYVQALVEGALQRGTFERRARSRPQAHPWDSNFAGLPIVDKPDPIHAATYRFHDLIHMLIGEAVLIDQTDPLSQQIYLLSRMQSEASTLFLADGLYVENLRRSGIEYDFSKRHAHPFLITTLGFSSEIPSAEQLREVIRANARFFVLGDVRPFQEMFSPRNDPLQTFNKYVDWYKTFSHVDAEWTRHNMHELVGQGRYRRAWWEGISTVIERNPYLNILSVDELASRIGWNRPARSRAELADLLDAIVQESFDRNLAPLIDNPSPTPLSAEEYSRRAFIRWMSGQLYLHHAIVHDVQHERSRDIITQALESFGPETREPIQYAQRIRAKYDGFVARLREQDRISPEEAQLWADHFPHVRPYYLSYGGAASHDTLDPVLNSITLTEEKSRGTEVHAQMSMILITDGERFFLRQRDDSTSPRFSMFGGPALPQHELSANEYPGHTLLRSLKLQIPDTAVASAVYHSSSLLDILTFSDAELVGAPSICFFVAKVTSESFDAWSASMHKLQSAPGESIVSVSRDRLRELLAEEARWDAYQRAPLVMYINRLPHGDKNDS